MPQNHVDRLTVQVLELQFVHAAKTEALGLQDNISLQVVTLVVKTSENCDIFPENIEIFGPSSSTGQCSNAKLSRAKYFRWNLLFRGWVSVAWNTPLVLSASKTWIESAPVGMKIWPTFLRLICGGISQSSLNFLPRMAKLPPYRPVAR